MLKLFFLCAVSMISFAVTYASPNYLMRLADVHKISDHKIEFNIFIKSTEANFELTSYQAALVYNNDTNSDLSFRYEEASSELSISPSTRIGVNHADGETKLTFASMPGSETITSSEVKVGRFILESEAGFNNSEPEIQWSFDGNVATILTGENFNNITNSENHTFQFKGQLPIADISASSTIAPGSTEYLNDGKLENEVDINANWKTDKMPAHLIFDLGNEQIVSRTRFSFNNWNKGRVYQYSILLSDDKANWTEVISNASSAAAEWTEDTFDNISARYVKLLIISQNQSEWATLWEAQIWGVGETTEVDEESEETPQSPADFALMQNYPNPFNPSTKIRFNLQAQGKVSLDVYNMLGERVAVLIDQEMAQGTHEVSFNGANLASGVYVYMLSVENKFSAVKKMMLLK